MRRLVAISVFLVWLAGCQSSVEPATDMPANAHEAMSKLRELEDPIVAAIRSGNPAACDEELHSAMFYADHLPDIAKKNGGDDNNIQVITDAAKTLFDLLMAAHDGDAAVTDGDEFATEIDEAMKAIEQAIP